MLSKWEFPDRPAGEEVERRLDRARERLEGLQLQVKQANLPVLVLVEGWGTAGKGSMIGRVIRRIDPRFFTVTSMNAPTAEERRYPFLRRYYNVIPAAGQFAFLDSGWMDEVVKQQLQEEIGEETYAARIASVRRFERGLVDNGYLLVKLFLHIDREEQARRMAELLSSEDTAWRVSDGDRWQNRHYRRCREAFERYLAATDLPQAPWHLIDARRRRWSETQIAETLCHAIEGALAAAAPQSAAPQQQFPLAPAPALARLDLTPALSETEYDRQREQLQKRLGQLHNRLYRRRLPVIVAMEGQDAAGKGGCIRRLTHALDPRGYVVWPIASPRPFEKERHYLWRFWTRLPKSGHIAIFDRSWYGRVLVERLEGFCTETDWRRAYHEINEFEAELTDWGAVVVKFWLQIDKDTQLKRFQSRQNDPRKRWKITEEDWRNRAKWDEYQQAADEMLQKTSTTFAPWHVIPSVDKKYARVQVLQTMVDAIERALP